MTTVSEIFSRLVMAQPHLSPEAARGWLSLSFATADVARVEELSQMAAEGSLTPVEQEELDAYERAGHLLAILHSKARLSLKQ